MHIHTCGLCSDAKFVCSVWQRYDALTTDGAAPLAHVSLPSLYLPSSAWSPHAPSYTASLRRCGVGVPESDSQSHLYSHHSSDCIAEMVMRAASATVSNIVGMIGTEAGLGVQTARMKVQWCVSN